MSIQHGGYRQIPATGEPLVAHKRSKRAPKNHGRKQRNRPTPKPRDAAQLAADFWRLIRNLNRALDGRHKPVDQQRVQNLERQLDRVVREWEAVDTT